MNPFKVGDTVYYVCNCPRKHIKSFQLVSVGKVRSKVRVPAQGGWKEWIKTVSNKSIASTPKQAFEQFRDRNLRKIESRVKSEMNSYVKKKKELENMKMFEVKNLH